jgi:hypothetical protein
MNDMANYIIYHPGTGTIVAAADSVLVNVDQLPPAFDDWEEYLATEWFKAVPVEVCKFDVISLDVVIEDLLSEGDKRPELKVLNALTRQELNDRVLILLSENPSLYKGVETLRRSLIAGLVRQEKKA